MRILDCLSGEKSRASWELHGDGKEKEKEKWVSQNPVGSLTQES